MLFPGTGYSDEIVIPIEISSKFLTLRRQFRPLLGDTPASKTFISELLFRSTFYNRIAFSLARLKDKRTLKCLRYARIHLSNAFTTSPESSHPQTSRGCRAHRTRSRMRFLQEAREQNDDAPVRGLQGKVRISPFPLPRITDSQFPSRMCACEQEARCQSGVSL